MASERTRRILATLKEILEIPFIQAFALLISIGLKAEPNYNRAYSLVMHLNTTSG
jgi:hypothetical protein